jgi:hypothetical protein
METSNYDDSVDRAIGKIEHVTPMNARVLRPRRSSEKSLCHIPSQYTRGTDLIV